MLSNHVQALVDLAVEEDLGTGDLTSNATISETACASAVIIAKESLVICGHEVAAAVFGRISQGIKYEVVSADGARAYAGDVLSRLNGPVRALLAGERTALNFLQRLSGIATQTARAVEKLLNTKARILDTRKTTPGWRELEKYAVRVGGGTNHRAGLFDAVLIKNNHVDALGGDLHRAVIACREKTPSGTKIEVEVRDMQELEAALGAAPDAILLDNMDLKQLTEAVNRVRRNKNGAEVELEASGGILLEDLASYAQTGVDSISLGALTHSVQAADIALRIKY